MMRSVITNLLLRGKVSETPVCPPKDPCVSVEIKAVNKTFANTIRQAKIYADLLSADAQVFEERLFPVSNTHWECYADYKVEAILCSLTDRERDITVINVKFDNGGFIPPLRHDRIKTIFVIHGELEDTVNNRVIKEHEIYQIAPNELHSLKSDNCLLTITWVPAYETAPLT